MRGLCSCFTHPHASRARERVPLVGCLHSPRRRCRGAGRFPHQLRNREQLLGVGCRNGTRYDSRGRHHLIPPARRSRCRQQPWEDRLVGGGGRAVWRPRMARVASVALRRSGRALRDLHLDGLLAHPITSRFRPGAALSPVAALQLRAGTRRGMTLASRKCPVTRRRGYHRKQPLFLLSRLYPQTPSASRTQAALT